MAEADKCVKCALCLPHCPTYAVSRDEAESPRGRIALMQGFASGELDVTVRLTGHLDHCLACRACEAVCPAGVPYGALIDAARAELERRGHGAGKLAGSIAFVARRPRLLAGAAALMRLAQRIGLVRVAAAAGPARWRRLARLLPPPHRVPAPTPAATAGREAMLFTGCIARHLDPETRAATIRVLNALGVAVRIPPGQTCCGALDLHNGRPEPARRAALQNVAAFATTSPGTTCLSTASGCGATLAEYGMLAGEAGAAFARHVKDISAYIVPLLEEQEPALRPRRQTVLLHTPCTLANVVRSAAAPAAMLAMIPDSTVVKMPPGCCGSAGSYMLTQPDMADRLVEPIVARARELRPDVVATSNIGCMLHIRAALKAAGLAIPVKHPVAILAEQLPVYPAVIGGTFSRANFCGRQGAATSHSRSYGEEPQRSQTQKGAVKSVGNCGGVH